MGKDVRLRKLERAVLDIIRDSETPVTNMTLQKELNKTYNTIANATRVLKDMHAIRTAVGVSMGTAQYFVFQSDPEVAFASPTQKRSFQRLDGTQIEAFLNKWSEVRWEPRIFRSASNLPQGLARLYSLASEVAYGSEVSRSELAEIQANLNNFLSDLEAVHAVVGAVLETPELWSTTTFAPFLLKGENVEVYRNKAHKMREIN